jgi:predicted site-specific integrase-resolvase
VVSVASGYEHWGEEAERVRYAETDFDSEFADESDENIKAAVYARMSSDDWDDDHDDW